MLNWKLRKCSVNLMRVMIVKKSWKPRKSWNQVKFFIFSAWSCVVSASIISSSSPFKACSSLYRLRLILWSVILLCGKLYVLIFSDLSPEPIWLFLSELILSCCSFNFKSYSLERRTLNALSLFFIWDFSSWQVTTSGENEEF